jgi:tetratricopeptide (TPR) repeat protein
MSVKSLKPTAIVPDSIYVERAADRQLREIIDEMGRPGYVLVARQMGKTNLLLHMKRERTNDMVIYIDLTSRFDTPRAWFRNIIDMLIEAYGEKFPDAAVRISQQRIDANLEPNVEFDRHLRTILREVFVKIIIILDEIDSLVNTSYSDVILSQIRSMYFSRANYPEYEKLTYVLSGVVEPTDLIKDKNISPFNIGEKIYLENFNFQEFIQFLYNANLHLDDDVAGRVFDWTNGNPRMTWDICAELENFFQTAGFLTKKDVDSIVFKTYLNEFDRAPIDHIRTLVESDQKIRDAIDEIRYGKGEVLDQSIKNRLYLAGIITSAGEDVTIANKVIDASLSDSWLKSLTSSSESIFANANEHFSEKRYSLAVEEFRRILKSAKNVTLSKQDRKHLALSYLHIGLTSDAVSELTLCISEESDPTQIQYLNLELGVAFAVAKNFPDAKVAFANARSGPDKLTSCKSQLEQTFVTLMTGDKKEITDGVEACSNIISEMSASELRDEQKHQEIVILAYYLRSQLLSKLKLEDRADIDLESAISLSSSKYKPGLLFAKSDMSKHRSTRIAVLRELLNLITEENLFVLDIDDSHLQLSTARVVDIFTSLIKENLVKEFKDFAKHCLSISSNSEENEFSLLKSLYNKSSHFTTINDSINILVWAIRYFDDVEQDWHEKIEVYREIVMVYGGAEKAGLRTRYLDELNIHESEKDSFFDVSHLEALTVLGNACIQGSEWPLARLLFDVWGKYRNSADRTSFYPLMMDYYELLCAKAGQVFTASVIDLSIRNLQTIKDHDASFANSAERDTVNHIKRDTEIIARGWVKTDKPKPNPLRNVGRNDWITVQYSGSDAQQKKFKFVEEDLKSGKCILINIVKSSK